MGPWTTRCDGFRLSRMDTQSGEIFGSTPSKLLLVVDIKSSQRRGTIFHPATKIMSRVLVCT